MKHTYRIGVDVNKGSYKNIKKIAALSESTVSIVINLAMEKYIADYTKANNIEFPTL